MQVLVQSVKISDICLPDIKIKVNLPKSVTEPTHSKLVFYNGGLTKALPGNHFGVSGLQIVEMKKRCRIN
jgi:hypothetical protein